MKRIVTKRAPVGGRDCLLGSPDGVDGTCPDRVGISGHGHVCPQGVFSQPQLEYLGQQIDSEDAFSRLTRRQDTLLHGGCFRGVLGEDRRFTGVCCNSVAGGLYPDHGALNAAHRGGKTVQHNEPLCPRISQRSQKGEFVKKGFYLPDIFPFASKVKRHVKECKEKTVSSTISVP